MKKNDLIKKLQQIKGNPDIKMWNGYVGDWMNIDIVEHELVKECEEFIRWWVEAEWKERNNTWEISEEGKNEIEESVQYRLKEREWDFPNKYLTPENEKRWYGENRKKIVLIESKLRGKNAYDRLGEISY